MPTFNIFTGVFLVALACYAGVQLWLLRRHVHHILSHRDRVPHDFLERIELASHQKAADYSVARARLSQVELSISVALILFWTLGGGLQIMDELWQRSGWPALAVGTGFLVTAVLIMSLTDLPTAAYRTFHIERRFGFNHTTPRLFVLDVLRGGLLMVLIGAPFAALVVWLMSVTGPYWWLAVWLAWMGLILLMSWAYPTLIAPLFNRFTPLRDEALEARIQALFRRCGFHSDGIYVMDGSKRSGHGNAYFTGLGKSKRIVFFDTLLESLDGPEIEAVLAHELGHFKRRHVLKNLVLMGFVSLLSLVLLAWAMERPEFSIGLGVATPSPHTALVLLLLISTVFGVFLRPLMNRFSRGYEFEADDFAARLTHPNALIRALVKLYRENANTLSPDPLYSAFYDSHPPASVRVANLIAQSQPQPSKA